MSTMCRPRFCWFIFSGTSGKKKVYDLHWIWNWTLNPTSVWSRMETCREKWSGTSLRSLVKTSTRWNSRGGIIRLIFTILLELEINIWYLWLSNIWNKRNCTRYKYDFLWLNLWTFWTLYHKGVVNIKLSLICSMYLSSQ